MSFFEHIAATDDSERIARRKSSVIAAQRFQNQFGAFLKGASSKEDFQARLALIDSDIKEMTHDVAEEYGGDPQVIESAVRRHFLGAAHTVEERDGEYFVVEDGGAETVAGPFDERQEAQDRASELDELEPLEKEAAWDEELQRDPEYTDENDEPTEKGWRDLVLSAIILERGDYYQHLIEGMGMDPEYVKSVIDTATPEEIKSANEAYECRLPLDQAFELVQSLKNRKNASQRTKVAVRRPKMCPYHSELTEASLQTGEPQYAAFSALVGGDSHCKGGFEGKCNFKSEMVTQEYWDKKAQDAAERKQQREQQQQEVMEVAEVVEEPIEEPVAESTELTDELSEAPSAVGEMSLEGEGAVEEISDEAMAMTARSYNPGNRVYPGDVVDVSEDPAPRKLVDSAPGGAAPQLHPEEVVGAGIPLDEDPNHMLTPEEVRRVHLMREKAAKFASLKQAKDCDCWKGYKRVPGTEPCAPGSCEKCDSGKKSNYLQDDGRVLVNDPKWYGPEAEFNDFVDNEAYQIAESHAAQGFALEDIVTTLIELKGISREKAEMIAQDALANHPQHKASRRQAEVAWDGGGATKNERGTWAWGHQEPKADESGLDDAPSGPAMDKTRWQPAALDPNGKGNLKPVDSEYPESPNPTIQQVLWERRNDKDVYGQQEFGDGIDSVTDKQELPAADETGLTTEKNLDQGSQGGTFPNEGQANPVTSKDDPYLRHNSKVAEIIGENAGRALYEDAVDRNMTVYDRLMEIYDQLEGMQGGEGLTEQAASDVERAMALIDNALADTYNNAEPTGDHEMMDFPDDPYDHGAGGGDPDDPVISKVANEESECLDCHPDDPCEGSVEFRMPLSGTGKSFPRCEKHFEQRLQRQDEINQRYPYNAPSDFDPGYAGERWDDEY